MNAMPLSMCHFPGVPAFYRWLSQKYPMMLQDVIEEEAEDVDGTEVPVDFSKPNPNGIEYEF